MTQEESCAKGALSLKIYLILSGVITAVVTVWIIITKQIWTDIAAAGVVALLAVNLLGLYRGSKAVRKVSFFGGLFLLMLFAALAIFVVSKGNLMCESWVLLSVALLSIAVFCCVFLGRGSFRKWLFCLGFVLLIVLFISFTEIHGVELS